MHTKTVNLREHREQSMSKMEKTGGKKKWSWNIKRKEVEHGRIKDGLPNVGAIFRIT